MINKIIIISRANIPKKVLRRLNDGIKKLTAVLVEIDIKRNASKIGCRSIREKANPPIKWCFKYVLFKPKNKLSKIFKRRVSRKFKENKDIPINPNTCPVLLREELKLLKRVSIGAEKIQIKIGGNMKSNNRKISLMSFCLFIYLKLNLWMSP